MTVVPIMEPRASEIARVEAWRLHVLVEAGYPVVLAERLAYSRTVDLREAERLLKVGCTPEVAARILL